MSTKIAPLEVRPVSDAAADIVPKIDEAPVGSALIVAADGASAEWGPASGAITEAGEFLKAVSVLSGLPYALSTDPSVAPVLMRTFGPALTGDIFLLEFFAEVENDSASPRNVFGSILVNGSSVQDSAAHAFAPSGTLGDIQFFTLRIAIPLDADASPTFACRIWASDVDVVATQVCFSATKIGQ